MERKRDYMTVQELTENEKYKFWYFKIKECKESGLSVKNFYDVTVCMLYNNVEACILSEGVGAYLEGVFPYAYLGPDVRFSQNEVFEFIFRIECPL